jgi:hypothetical protein
MNWRRPSVRLNPAVMRRSENSCREVESLPISCPPDGIQTNGEPYLKPNAEIQAEKVQGLIQLRESLMVIGNGNKESSSPVSSREELGVQANAGFKILEFFRAFQRNIMPEGKYQV